MPVQIERQYIHTNMHMLAYAHTHKKSRQQKRGRKEGVRENYKHGETKET